jgi:hypothetical protein
MRCEVCTAKYMLDNDEILDDVKEDLKEICRICNNDAWNNMARKFLDNYLNNLASSGVFIYKLTGCRVIKEVTQEI